MTTKQLSTSELAQIMEQASGLRLKFTGEYTYYRISSSQYDLIVATRSPAVVDIPDLVSTGICLLEQHGGKWKPLPSLLDVLHADILTVNHPKAVLLSQGKSVQQEPRSSLESQKHWLVQDNHHRNIALVFARNDQLVPVVDIGMYLRHESSKNAG